MSEGNRGSEGERQSSLCVDQIDTNTILAAAATEQIARMMSYEASEEV